MADQITRLITGSDPYFWLSGTERLIDTPYAAAAMSASRMPIASLLLELIDGQAMRTTPPRLMSRPTSCNRPGSVRNRIDETTAAYMGVVLFNCATPPDMMH